MCLTQAVRCEPASAFTGEGLRSSGSWGINAGRREQRWQMAEQPMIARQLPDRGEIFLDHLAHFVPSLDCAAAVLEKLGFRLTPFAAQRNRPPNGNEPSGMANRCVMLREGYRSEEHTSEPQSLMRIS